LIRHEVKLAALSAVPAVLVAVACLAAFGWYRRRQDPIELGKALNQRAWESSFEERGLPVPASGPRDGYWGSRLGPKVADPSVGWHEGSILVPDLLDVDARGFQHYVSPAERKSRVVVFGGSVAFGGYASAISATYFHVLGTELERLSTPADITIVAGGAWKAIQEADALYAYGAQLEPDLIVFLDGLNDLTNGATSRTLFGQRTATSDGSEWTPQYHAHDYEQRVADYLTIIGRAAELSARRGGKMLVVLQPSLAERTHRTRIEETLLRGSLVPHASAEALTRSYQTMREGLRARAASGTFRFLDCSRIFDQERATTFSDLWHFSDIGHEILGKTMAREIATMLQNPDGRTKPDPGLDQR